VTARCLPTHHGVERWTSPTTEGLACVLPCRASARREIAARMTSPAHAELCCAQHNPAYVTPDVMLRSGLLDGD
jgi:hypothetical protein